MSEEPEWDELAKKLSRITERMMLAGWAKGTRHDLEGFGVEYTPEGMEKTRELWELLAPLDLGSMDLDDLDGLRAVLLAEAKRRGWSSGFPNIVVPIKRTSC